MERPGIWHSMAWRSPGHLGAGSQVSGFQSMNGQNPFGESGVPEITHVGAAMQRLIVELYPICRSITGNGVRKTLEILRRDIPLEVHEVPSGTKVFDWTVPKEWNIRDAYVKNTNGKRVIDFNKSNLHVVGY